MSRCVTFLAILFTVAALGCSRGPAMGTITGEVTYDGKPLSHGTILLEVSGQMLSRGEIEEGKIVNMTTFTPGDGAPVGEAVVAINSIAEVTTKRPNQSGNNGTGGSGEVMVQGQDLIPVRYSNPATSGLTATIEPGVNDLHFDLTK
ncbi:hypothetical protein [Blastopirellula marina]|uniref:Carboxypeptidase regulatory-like domain-containing protein n=1 Tax=Blastopirellula marina TaxID=124 RepID=A0A2S8GLE4_9BACT|nr:hypothetical protein [Blastopirellula marina]PQO45230.1 hypothetical protein C5Y93_14805 [Blastopirellula marina]